jgi:hypothetical protein
MHHVITVANKSDGYYEILKESCIRNGCTLTTLGFGEKWGGFVWRLTLIQEYLKSLDQSDIVIIIDGFDVIMTEHIDTFIRKYNEFGKSIIIGISDLNLLTKYMFKRIFKSVLYENNQYTICAGMYVGRAHDLLIMYDLIDQYLGFKNYNDDQVLLCKFLNSTNREIQDFRKYKIGFDTQATLFNNTARKSSISSIFKYTDNINLSYDPVLNTLVNQYGKPSSFIHGPGSINLKPYIEKLGYKNIPDVIPYTSTRFTHYIGPFISGMFLHDWIFIFIILIFIIITGMMIKQAVVDRSRNKKRTQT